MTTNVSFQEAWMLRNYLEPQAMRNVINRATKSGEQVTEGLILEISAQPPEKPLTLWWEKIKLCFWLFSAENRTTFVDAVNKTNAVATNAIKDFQDKKANFDTARQYRAQKEICDAETPYRFNPLQYVYGKEHKEKCSTNKAKLQALEAVLTEKNIKVLNIDEEIERLNQMIQNSRKFLNILSTTLFTQQSEIAAKLRQTIQVKPNKEAMLDDIAQRIHPDLKEIWELLFNKFEKELKVKEIITAWDCDPNGNFKLTLSRPLRMWVPSSDETGKEDPVGGVILMLGYEDGLQIKGTLGKDGSSRMEFESGFYCHVHTFGMKLTPNIFGLIYNGKDDVKFGAGAVVGGISLEKWRPKTIEYLKTNWADNGVILKDAFVNPKDMRLLNAKIDEMRTGRCDKDFAG